MKPHRGAGVALRAVLTIAAASWLVAAPPALEAAHASQAKQMLHLTNKDRRDHHRGKLRLDKRLSKYAKRHSQDMIDQGGLFHTPDLGKVIDHHWHVAGENVGEAPDLPTLENAFMHSHDHRKNILKRAYEHVGIGVVESGGNLWVTVIFYG